MIPLQLALAQTTLLVLPGVHRAVDGWLDYASSLKFFGPVWLRWSAIMNEIMPQTLAGTWIWTSLELGRQNGFWHVSDPRKVVFSPTAPRWVLEPWCLRSCPQPAGGGWEEASWASPTCGSPESFQGWSFAVLCWQSSRPWYFHNF